MTPRLFVRKSAKADVATAFAWYETHRAGLGEAFAEEVSVAYAAIEEQPLRFPIVVDDIRMRWFTGFRTSFTSSSCLVTRL